MSFSVDSQFVVEVISCLMYTSWTVYDIGSCPLSSNTGLVHITKIL